MTEIDEGPGRDLANRNGGIAGRLGDLTFAIAGLLEQTFGEARYTALGAERSVDPFPIVADEPFGPLEDKRFLGNRPDMGKLGLHREPRQPRVEARLPQGVSHA